MRQRRSESKARPAQRTRWLGGLVALGLVTGCARNAGLDITFDLPPASSGTTATFAFVQFRRASNGFGTWIGTNDQPGRQLDATHRSSVEYSLLTEEFENDVFIEIHFCSSATCTNGDEGDNAPSIDYQLEHPFYRGHRTMWATPPLAIPTGSARMVTVDRCHIAGCIVGPLDANYCRSDGSHFCESPGSAPPSDAGPGAPSTNDAARPSDAASTHDTAAAHDASGDET